MVGQHDAAGADPDRACPGRDMGDHDRRRGAGNSRHVVMLGDPDAAIAPALGMSGQIAGIVERAARVRFLGHADEVEDGQRRHGILPEEAHFGSGRLE